MACRDNCCDRALGTFKHRTQKRPRAAFKMSPRTMYKFFTALMLFVVGLLLLHSRGLGLEAWATVMSWYETSVSSLAIPSVSLRPPLPSRRCPDVLHNMLTGKWHQRLMSSKEVELMSQFHRKVPTLSGDPLLLHCRRPMPLYTSICSHSAAWPKFVFALSL